MCCTMASRRVATVSNSALDAVAGSSSPPLIASHPAPGSAVYESSWFSTIHCIAVISFNARYGTSNAFISNLRSVLELTYTSGSTLGAMHAAGGRPVASEGAPHGRVGTNLPE